MTTTHTVKFYNNIAWIYPMLHPFLARGQRKLMRKVNVLATGEVLEIGTGTGAHLSKYEQHQVTGIDFSEKRLKRAARKTQVLQCACYRCTGKK
jgi:ubiquinone/menaquinone biosynthesis C-methylase UbiE